MIKPVSKTPAECTETERAVFCKLVREGGQVHDVGLEGRVERAKKLVFLHDGATLAGIAAIKNPTPQYRQEVFQKADVPLDEPGYQLELGYVVVTNGYKGRKLSRVLVEVALQGLASTPLFATSRADRKRMHRTLIHFSFVQTGKPYASQEEDCDVLLFTRSAVQQKEG